jgi:dTDP-4-amino-4,6-dideoxygalactose transaminase
MTVFRKARFAEGAAGLLEKIRPADCHGRVVAKQRINPIAYWRLLTRGSAADEANFVSAMKARFGPSCSAVPIGRARAGIYLLVKFALRDGRRKVLLSPYTIPDVVNMVLLAGGEPVFFDYEPGTTSCDVDQFDSLIDDVTACAILTHYHINEPRLAELQALCRRRGILLFDDCAIAFGGSVARRPLGVLTDASIFSFSSFKLLNFFWGGLVTTCDDRIARFVRKTVESWPRMTCMDYRTPARRCLQYDLASRSPLFDKIVFPQLRRRSRQSGRPAGLDFVRSETETLDGTITSRPSYVAFAEWNGKLPNAAAGLSHRRTIARVYSRALGGRMVSADVPQSIVQGSCFVNFPVLASEQRRDAICREMMLAGYDLGRSLYPNVHRNPRFRAFAGYSTNVDRLVNASVYLPTHFGVSESYAQELAGKLSALLGGT